VRIPRHIADEARLKEGDALEIEVAPEGAVQLLRVEKIPSLTQLVSQISPENRYQEMASGPEVGKETLEW
jgi:antitoxin component of MazEF toxin-antitoxin module